MSPTIYEPCNPFHSSVPFLKQFDPKLFPGVFQRANVNAIDKIQFHESFPCVTTYLLLPVFIAVSILLQGYDKPFVFPLAFVLDINP